MELVFSKDGGFFGRVICGTLFALFSRFEWFIPATLIIIGFGMCVDSLDAFFALSLGAAAVTFLFLCSAMFHLGTAGNILSSIFHSLFGTFSPTIEYGLIGLLIYSLANVGEDRTVIEISAFCANPSYVLRNLQMPSIMFFTNLLRRRRIATSQADPTIPIAMPVRKSARNNEYVEAKFVDFSTERTARTQRPASAKSSHRLHSKKYQLPELTILNAVKPTQTKPDRKEATIVETLAQFGIQAEVVGTEIGPTITRYKLSLAKGVKIKSITALQHDITRALSAVTLRIEAPIPGTSLLGIEIPSSNPTPVFLREILEAQRSNANTLMIALGKDVVGKPISADLCSMPHTLVAGATGSGKSVCLNSIIASLLMTATPEQVRMLLIDPKRVELKMYEGIPHLLQPIIDTKENAPAALSSIAKEMDSRLERFAKVSVRKIEEYNAKFMEKRLPYIVVVIDELADLMQHAKKIIEPLIDRIAFLARATGIHLVIATQRPSVNVITGKIKANIPSRIAFSVSAGVDSRTILDAYGAEKLIGQGDMLYLHANSPKPVRIQGAFISLEETERLVAFWCAQGASEAYKIPEPDPVSTLHLEQNESRIDPLVVAAARYVIGEGSAATSKLQAQFECGNPRAVWMMHRLEGYGIVGPHQGRQPREVIMTLDELDALISTGGEGCKAA